MKWILALLIAAPLSSIASCWMVEQVKGSSYSERNSYKQTDDGYSGKFTIVINGNNAAVVYDGLDAGGMIYRPLSANSVIGMTTEQGKHAIETWVIQNDGTVLMAKTMSGFGGVDSTKAMVGKVTGICQ